MTAQKRTLYDKLWDVAGAGNTAGGEFTVDLEDRTIITPDGHVIPFAVEDGRRDNLLSGPDEIGATSKHETEIQDVEHKRTAAQPWQTENRHE